MKSVFEVRLNDQKYIVKGIIDRKRNILTYVDKDSSIIKIDLEKKCLKKDTINSIINIDFSLKSEVKVKIYFKDINKEIVSIGKIKKIEYNELIFTLNYFLYDTEEIYYSLKIIKWYKKCCFWSKLMI